MSDGGAREWRFYIDDMIAFSEKVIAYSEDFDRDGFVGSGLHYDAALRNPELIGEAAGRVPESIRVANPGIPWRLVIATRNRLIHGYLGLDSDLLWSIVKHDVPALLSQLKSLKATFGAADG